MSSRRGSTPMESQLNQKLFQRRRELENLRQIQTLTSQLNLSLEDLGIKLKALDRQSGSISEVTVNWGQIGRSISLASTSLAKYKEEDFELGKPMTERLVRCKLDEDLKIAEKKL